MELTAEAPIRTRVRSWRAGEARWGQPALRRLWDGHGAAAYSLACALLGDEAAAADAVWLAMADVARDAPDEPEELRRRLVCQVYRRAQQAAERTPGAARLPRAMVWLSTLARLQRASLALCVYGGLTHRETAALLDVPPATVADLLTTGLREIGRLAATDAASCA